MKVRIVAHMMVKNEPWAWYAAMSVVDFVDQLLIVDTGSTDGTDKVLASIQHSKITFRRRPTNGPEDISACRQEMLNETKADWLFLVDGDEIWPRFALEESIACLAPDNKFIISSFRNVVGDIYHYQESAAGRYHIGPYKGHVTIRFYNLNSKLHYQGAYPLEGFYTQDGKSLLDLYTHEPLIITPYLHLTHLHPVARAVHGRSHKYELGLSMENDFSFPVSFYIPRPLGIQDVWHRRGYSYLANALWQTPLKFVKRRLNI